ncbi:GIY-YIG nuclease family protein [Pantoea dispersa]|uniref:GIY-YIG nuclease family protein n=1 Tax=Pantoea dispersa TaxID=59814 RepID=UPI003019E783
MQSSSNGYIYAGHHLTPTSFAKAAIKVCANMKIKREDVIKLVLEYHLANGGTEGSTNLKSTAKKANNLLISQGKLKNSDVYGIWDFSDTGDVVTFHASLSSDKKNFVYAYYLPSYQELAQLKGQPKWPIKIGRTAISVEERVSNQAATAVPEIPKMIFEIECEDGHKLEKAIHSILDYRSQRQDNALGIEWFNTNPSELAEILNLLGHSFYSSNSIDSA